MARPERHARRHRPHLDPTVTGRLVIDDVAAAELLRGSRGRDRLTPAMAAGVIAGGRTPDAEILRALAEARIEHAGEVMYGSNAVFLLQLDAPDPEIEGEPLRAIYKPVRGERPLWDFPRHTLFLREAATYLVDAALDLGHVPPTVLRDGPVGPGSLQLFVRPVTTRPEAAEVEQLEAQLRDIAALDVLVNNADRKRSHLLVTHGPWIRAIDNALTFLPYPRQRTALIELGGTRLPPKTASRVRALARERHRLDALLERLGRLLGRTELEAFRHRVKELAADPVYPVLDDWDGRPFEWW